MTLKSIRWSVISIIIVSLFAITPPVLFAQSADLDGLVIVADGQAHAVIVYESVGGLRGRMVAENFADYIRKSTGVRVPFITEREYATKEDTYADDVKIYLGLINPETESRISANFNELDDQGFVIYPSDREITIAGPTQWGMVNGVHHFLERYLDIRWLIAGSNGEDVPRRTDVVVPMEIIQRQPTFELRRVSGGYSGAEPLNPLLNPYSAERETNMWALRNGLQGSYNHTLDHGHNIGSLFSPSLFYRTNPEFYPNGQLPAEISKRWQPCFTVDGVVDAAVERILDYFDTYPDRNSISLGTNDIGGFCEDDPSHPDFPGRERNSVNRTHMSEIYYKWVNDVVGRVTEVYPDKWFGVLAYMEVMDPPAFQLHPRVVPVITKDRMAWIDDDIRRQGDEQQKQWNKVAAQTAWWEYTYGFYYFAPRVYPHQMANMLRYAKEHNVLGIYAEMQYTPADGPKLWVLAKLMWDPDQDVDALLTEWYERTVGPKAAPYLAEFYDHWEHFWTERIKESPWFSSGKYSTYLPFTSPSYLTFVTDEDIEKSVDLLRTVVQHAETEEQKARAMLIEEAFEFHQAAMRSYNRSTLRVNDHESAMQLLDHLVSNYDSKLYWGQRRYELIDAYAVHRHAALNRRPGDAIWDYWWRDWSGWNQSEFDSLVSYIKAREAYGGPLTDRIQKLVANEDEATRRLAVFILLALGNRVDVPSLLQYSSFDTNDSDLSPWIVSVGSNGRYEISQENVHTGRSALKISGSNSGEIRQQVDITPGLTGVQLNYSVGEGVAFGSVQISVNGLNARGQSVFTHQSSVVPLSADAGEWGSVQLVTAIPYQVSRDKIVKAEVTAVINGLRGGDVYIDDFVLYRHVPDNVEVDIEEREATLSNLAFGKPAEASSVLTDRYVASNAVNGNYNTQAERWVSATSSGPEWLEIDLLGRFSLKRVEVYTGNFPASGPPWNMAVKSFSIQYWRDGEWVNIPGASTQENDETHVTFDLDPPIITDKIRFYVDKVGVLGNNASTNNVRVREIEVYGVPAL